MSSSEKPRIKRLNVRAAERLAVVEEQSRVNAVGRLKARILASLDAGQSPDEVIRSVYEGSAAGTDNDQLRKIGEARTRLLSRQARVRDQITQSKPLYDSETARRDAMLRSDELWTSIGLNDVIRQPHGSRVAVLINAVVVILLESAFLVPTLTSLLESSFPGWSSDARLFAAWFGVIALVGLGALLVVAFARVLKEYLDARKKTDLLLHARESATEHVAELTALKTEPPRPGALMFLIVSTVLYGLLLFFVRFLGDSDLSDQSRSLFIFVSAIISLLPVTIGYLEFNLHDPNENRYSYDQSIVSRHLALVTEAETEIPNELAELAKLESRVHDTVLASVQGIAAQMPPEFNLPEVVNRLRDQARAKWSN